MATISTFPTATNRILTTGDNQYTFSAGTTLLAGQLVQIKLSGGNFTVYPAALANSTIPIGVVDQNATSGDSDVTVNLWGTTCYVANIDDTTAIEAGSAVKVASDTSVNGCVQAWAGGATEYIIGTAITDIAANGWGKVLILPQISAIA